MFSKKNDTNPMEDETSAEFLMSKNDCALFCFGSHNKKRPNNLVLVRMTPKEIRPGETEGEIDRERERDRQTDRQTERCDADTEGREEADRRDVWMPAQTCFSSCVVSVDSNRY